MKTFVLMAAVAVLVGCSAVKDELGYAGGFTERVADDNLFAARGQAQRADRYLMSLTILAPLAGDLADSPSQAKAASTLINASYETLARMRQAIDANCLTRPDANVDACEPAEGNTEFAFESHAYDMQSKLFSLAKLVLNNSDLDDLADDIVELNLLGIASGVRRAFPVLRRSFATYRDTVVTFGDAIAFGPACTEASCGKLQSQLLEMKSGAQANPVLGDEDGRAIAALARSMKRVADNDNPTWVLESRHRTGLIYHIDRACARLKAIQSAELSGSSIEDCESTRDDEKATIVDS